MSNLPILNLRTAVTKSAGPLVGRLVAIVLTYVTTLLATHGVITNVQASNLVQQIAPVAAVVIVGVFIELVSYLESRKWLQHLDIEIRTAWDSGKSAAVTAAISKYGTLSAAPPIRTLPDPVAAPVEAPARPAPAPDSETKIPIPYLAAPVSDPTPTAVPVVAPVLSPPAVLDLLDPPAPPPAPAPVTPAPTA